MSMPRRERFTLNDPWYEPSNIMWWGFLGGIAVGAVGFVLGPTSDFGPLFLLLAMAMWTVALFAMVAFYVSEAWAAFRSARQRADDALRLAERIGEVPPCATERGATRSGAGATNDTEDGFAPCSRLEDCWFCYFWRLAV